MRGRWRWRIVGAAGIVAAGGAAVWATATPPDLPVHFWMPDGENRAYASPDGALLGAWDVSSGLSWGNQTGVNVTSRNSWTDRLRSFLHLPAGRAATVYAVAWPTAGEPPSGWREFGARMVIGGALGDTPIDAGLTGCWEVPGDAERRMTLSASGDVAEGDPRVDSTSVRWARRGDVVLVFSDFNTSLFDDASVCRTLLLSPDCRTMRDEDGRIWHKVD